MGHWWTEPTRKCPRLPQPTAVSSAHVAKTGKRFEPVEDGIPLRRPPLCAPPQEPCRLSARPSPRSGPPGPAGRCAAQSALPWSRTLHGAARGTPRERGVWSPGGHCPENHVAWAAWGVPCEQTGRQQTPPTPGKAGGGEPPRGTEKQKVKLTQCNDSAISKYYGRGSL